jgi:hypothetical protein
VILLSDEIQNDSEVIPLNRNLSSMYLWFRVLIEEQEVMVDDL